MPDIKPEYNPCPYFDMLAWNDGIENTKIICSSVHTSTVMQIIARFLAICSAMLIAIISEILCPDLEKSQDFNRDAKTEICILLISASVNAPYVA